jgi:hypothetical protein
MDLEVAEYTIMRLPWMGPKARGGVGRTREG